MFKSPLHVCQAAEAIVKLGFSDFVGIIHIAGPRMSVFDFTQRGLRALGCSTDNLKKELMPRDKPKFLPDTSLNFQLMERLVGITPMGVAESFAYFGDQTSL